MHKKKRNKDEQTMVVTMNVPSLTLRTLCGLYVARVCVHCAVEILHFPFILVLLVYSFSAAQVSPPQMCARARARTGASVCENNPRCIYVICLVCMITQCVCCTEKLSMKVNWRIQAQCVNDFIRHWLCDPSHRYACKIKAHESSPLSIDKLNKPSFVFDSVSSFSA